MSATMTGNVWGPTIPAWSVQQLTVALNKIAPTPRLLASLEVFDPRPMSVATATIEMRDQRLALVPEQPRGAPANRNVMGERGILSLAIPYFPLSDTVMADSIMGVRAFGTDNTLESWGVAVDRRLTQMSRHHDATLEHLRLGAVRGEIITAVDRETGAPLHSIDLFAAFDVAPPEPVEFPMAGDGARTAEASFNGAIMTACREVWRRVEAALGEPPPGLAAICGSAFFDALTLSAEFRSTFLGTSESAQLRDRGLFVPAFYGFIRFHDYGAARVGGLSFVQPDECHFVPLGVPDLFIEAYAPADYVETVNTVALPRYAKQEPLPMGKGVEIETQQNVLPLCTAPGALITGKLVEA